MRPLLWVLERKFRTEKFRNVAAPPLRRRGAVTHQAVVLEQVRLRLCVLPLHREARIDLDGVALAAPARDQSINQFISFRSLSDVDTRLTRALLWFSEIGCRFGANSIFYAF